MPKCPIWPSKPPRGDILCETSALCHPLVSPVASTTWKGLPPFFLAYGEECLGEEGKFAAQRAHDDGVVVEFHYYQRLIHCFPMFYPDVPQSQHLLKELVRFCKACVHSPNSLKRRNVTYSAETTPVKGEEVPAPFFDMKVLDFEGMKNRMRKKQAERPVWTGPKRLENL